MILVASDVAQLEPYVELLPEKILSTWPGPVTWLVPAKNTVSTLLRGIHINIAVRISAHPVVAQLCTEFNSALVSTSANPEGLPPAMSEQAVHDYFGNEILVVPGALGNLDKPTVIRDSATGDVIRA